VFLAGAPARGLYRKYRVKTVQGSDDFASIQEIVDRRLSRALAEGQPLPDLLLIDGGEGQVAAAKRALEKYDLRSLPMIGLAKREETIVFPDHRAPLQLSRRSEALRLLQRVRNEAHRFAVSYHRALRSNRLRSSVLDGIEGVGPQRKALLLRTFGSPRALARASEAEIAAVPGIGRAMARRILAALGDRGETGSE
jgi:excinuclease ABC subunit C